MTTADHLRTALGILSRVDRGLASPAAVALVAIHLAWLPIGPTWGKGDHGEPLSSEDHMHEAVVRACRSLKSVGITLDAMAVAILAGADVHAAYEATEPEPRPDVTVYTLMLDAAMVDTAPIEPDPVADAPTVEPEAEVEAIAVEPEPATEAEPIDAPSEEASPDLSPTEPPVAPDEAPKPRTPRCGRVYGQSESDPATDLACTRPEGHKGACGERRTVGKKAT